MYVPKNIAEARGIQDIFREKVLIVPFRGEPKYVAGVDAAFSDDHVFATACLYTYPELMLVEQAFAVRRISFPYIPGYLSFREGPAAVAAIKKLQNRPDIILVDGQGIAHPRGIGIASHIGVLLGTPTIGCAKTRLIGEFKEPGSKKGRWSALRYEGKIIGAVLRTRDNVRPLFVSPGHLVDIESAVSITLNCVGRFRIPEPLRCADQASRWLKEAASTTESSCNCFCEHAVRGRLA